MDEFFENFDAKTKFICTACTIFSLIVTTMIAMSFGVVEPTEYGILYNSVSKTIDENNIYGGGLQYVGVFNSMLTFPAVNKVIEFSEQATAKSKPLNTRTKEGLALKIHLAFQYKLDKNNLPKLYRLVGTDYEGLFLRIAADVILQEAGKYAAPEYWKSRQIVGEKLKTAVDERLKLAHASCTGLMLLKIDLPDSYENAIVDTQIVNQETITQSLIKEVKQINTGIEVDKAKTARNITII